MTATTSTIPVRPSTRRASVIAFVAGLAVAGSTFLAVETVRDGGRAATPASATRSAPAAEDATVDVRGGVPLSPDAAERWLDRDPRQVPVSPDAAERWLSDG